MNRAQAGASTFVEGCYRGYEVQLRLHRTSEYQPVQLSRPRDVYEFMRDLQNESSEHLYELLMDTKHRLNGVHLVGKGSVDSCPADPTEIYRAALLTNSPCFVLVHNHPSGIPEPSPDDRSLVQRIGSGSELLGLELLDFLIIGNSSYFSFKECGMLER